MSTKLSAQRFYFRVWIYALPVISLTLAAYIRALGGSIIRSKFEYDIRFYVAVVIYTTVVWAWMAERGRLCQVEELFQEPSDIIRVFRVCASTYILLIFVLFFYRHQSLSRIFFGLSGLLLFLMTLLSRVLVRRLLSTMGRPSRLKVLVVGADDYAKRIARRLCDIPFAQSEVVAYVRVSEQSVAVEGAPVVEMSSISKERELRVDDIVVALPPSRADELSEVVRQLEPLCIPIRTVLDFGDIPIVRDRLFRLGDLQMLDLSSTPIESPYYFLLKGAFDRLFSICALILAGPLMIAIAILIKCTSHGPVFFRQERVGLNGRSFWMYKFRTMSIAERSETDTSWTTVNDSRRTWVGTFLRKSGMDELPQFFNVLRGDMSVVGPRPERPYFVGKFLSEIAHYDARHRLKVGITGWAQVHGLRGDTSVAKRLEYDLFYLQNWSLWLDLRIIFLTMWSGVFGKNAY